MIRVKPRLFSAPATPLLHSAAFMLSSFRFTATGSSSSTATPPNDEIMQLLRIDTHGNKFVVMRGTKVALEQRLVELTEQEHHQGYFILPPTEQ